jgi:hypothetical protein
MGIGKQLMRVGRPDEHLPEALRAIVGRLRTDLVRFGSGREASGAVRLEGEAVVVDLAGRDAGFVARQLARRVHPPLRAVVEGAERGHASLRVMEGRGE